MLPRQPPSKDVFVIFTSLGEPAYCTDEGIDGPVCCGDASVFLGSGTLKDLMNEGTKVYLSYQQSCVLPKSFNPDARG